MDRPQYRSGSSKSAVDICSDASVITAPNLSFKENANSVQNMQRWKNNCTACVIKDMSRNYRDEFVGAIMWS